ncbi:MAG: outer membrane protein transport protein [Rhodocyclaceae bacterium]|nr:outer membrane protein transport protein [Rhodocyclaceae bacterium]
MKLKQLAISLAAAGIAAPAFATNGMNMEGYGPIATAMGGASYAYDNGTAGMINNPATLGFMKSGTSRLDVALGGLHPDVVTKMAGMPDAKSGGDAYYMPAIGYVRKDGRLAWGIGMMAQGGMGTEYGSGSFLSMGSGQESRSELGIGRIMFPFAYDLTDALRIGGSIDYLWGGLDIQMVMTGTNINAMMMGTSPVGRASTTIPLPPIAWAQFDFSEGKNKFKQRLTTDGWAWNIGFTWQAAANLSIGAVYHAKTSLSDMEGRGRLNNNLMPISGTLKVIDFQWPETIGIGLAYHASPSLLIAADYKRINWSEVMKNFRMHFVADGGMGTMDATLYQNWKDQDVFMLGASYQYSPQLTLRFGVNLAKNPVPNEYMHPLFPATIKNHVTFGFGYAFDKASSIDFSLAHAPRVSATNNNLGGITTTHAQATNWQFMYSHRF